MGEENMSFPGCGPGTGESFMPRNLFIDSYLRDFDDCNNICDNDCDDDSDDNNHANGDQ